MPTTPNSKPEATRADAIKENWRLSDAGFVKDGEEIFVPWGTTEKWNLILSIYKCGVNEIGSQSDNALMEIAISERELGNKSGWEISSKSAFRYWNSDGWENLPVTLKYLMVAK